MTVRAKMTNTGTPIVNSEGEESSRVSQEAVVRVLGRQFAGHEHIAPHEAIADA